MDFKSYSKKIRAAGARNVPGDTRLLHATPREEAILKLLGGSGEIDPDTGLPHYREVDSGGGGDGNESGSQNTGNEGRGGYGGGESDGGNDNWGSGRTSNTGTGNPANSANFDNAGYTDQNAARASHFSTAAEKAAIEAGDYSQANAVASGTAYGIDAGARTHSWKDTLKGFLGLGTVKGVRGVKGAALNYAIGQKGSPQINGGGWNTANGATSNDGSAFEGHGLGYGAGNRDGWGGYSEREGGNDGTSNWASYTKGQGLSYGNGSTGATGGTTTGTTNTTTGTTTTNTNTNPYYALYLAAYNKYKKAV
jgi:hypothetical protein